MELPPLPWHTPQIEAVLPHRSPILLVDRVTSIEPDKRIVGDKAWSRDEALHVLPDGRPLVPPSLLVDTRCVAEARLIYK